jgi:transcriptional regulator with XRE-family HTH domain
MFKKIFIALCNQKGESPSYVCDKIGITPSAFSQWTDATIPRQSTIKRTAEYFDVSIDYLLGKEEKEIPLGRIVEREDDELWSKISQLDEIDRGKVDGFVSGLLAAEKYQTFAKIKKA